MKAKPKAKFIALTKTSEKSKFKYKNVVFSYHYTFGVLGKIMVMVTAVSGMTQTVVH